MSAAFTHYEVTINDPKTYTAPWTVAFEVTHEPGYQIFEYACHEGNYAVRNSLSARDQRLIPDSFVVGRLPGC
jgi:hypothetical protein